KGANENKPEDKPIINTDVVDYSSNATLPSSIDLISENNVVVGTTRTGGELSYIDAIKKVEKSAVAILVSTSKSTSAGSGTIVNISRDGDDENVFYVLTCYHVIGYSGATVQVCLPDENNRNYGDNDYNSSKFVLQGTIGGTDTSGKVPSKNSVSLVGGDKDSDVALLRLYITDSLVKNNISKANIMNPSNTLCKGYEVFAIGNPTGTLQGTVSQGYIGYVNRNVNIGDIGEMVLNQINLDIYHGSSGGGLYNLYGELVGITNAGSDENSGLNYAIPLKITNDNFDKGFYNVATQLLASYSETNYGYVSGRKIKFGFTVSPNTEGKPYVVSIVANGLAETAGLQQNDIVTKASVNEENKPFSNYQEFISVLDGLKIGDTLVLTVDRTYRVSSWGGSKTEVRSFDISLTVYQFYFCNTADGLTANIGIVTNSN
ncbi:MAG: trypsin-like peptidase domain-containing protein, partial [Firmicutes bacterium]|nr:trypsin-like peptidase domain-containing protein [Candidatus Caballimonas caccae]